MVHISGLRNIEENVPVPVVCGSMVIDAAGGFG